MMKWLKMLIPLNVQHDDGTARREEAVKNTDAVLDHLSTQVHHFETLINDIRAKEKTSDSE